MACVTALALTAFLVRPASPAGSAATASARLLALDRSLFDRVASLPASVADNSGLRTLNEALYPEDHLSVAATRNQCLLALNRRLFPSEVVPAVVASTGT